MGIRAVSAANGRKQMKNETVSSLLESGEIQRTEDVIFMLDAIMAMFERGMESDASGQFMGYAVQLIEVWRTSLATNEEKMELSEEALNIVMGKK